MIVVTCAIIEKDSKVLCAQRSELMHLALKWEFPGGKVEAHTYPDQKMFELIPYRCSIAGGKLVAKEHKLVKWLNRSELRELDWAEADIPVLNHYLINYG